MKHKTEQEAYWAGAFGDEYISRNYSEQLLASNLAFFSRCLTRITDCKSCLEFGANVGMNLRALKLLFPQQEQSAIEINERAVQELRHFVKPENIFCNSILEFESERQWDLVLIKGVLIHINPDWLPQVYKKLYAAMRHYILIAEYYNPSPVGVPYRGHSDWLFKRDFCGEMMDLFPDLKLVDYGFAYRRDPSFPQDDITWFLLRKMN
jgi:spore coat polysaccharide biosynthesis protein SpsF